MTRVLSGVQPSGDFHLGNYLGALRQWVADQYDHDAFYCVVDLHALTLDIDPAALRARTIDAAVNLLAAGLDPEVCTLFVQSHVPEHPRLTWLLECTATMGELRPDDPVQGQGPRTGQRSGSGLFTYPVLMAADILLYDADRVPVGDDQRQHLELTRDLADPLQQPLRRDLRRPRGGHPDGGGPGHGPPAPRAQDVQVGRLAARARSAVLDDPAEIDRKVRKAVTDTDGEVRYDPEAKPGVSNLLELLAAATDRLPAELAAGYQPLRRPEARRRPRPGRAAAAGAGAPRRARRPTSAPSTRCWPRGRTGPTTVAARHLPRAADAVGLLPGLSRDRSGAGSDPEHGWPTS